MTQSNLDGKAWRTARRSTEWLVLRRAWHGAPDVYRYRALRKLSTRHLPDSPARNSRMTRVDSPFESMQESADQPSADLSSVSAWEPMKREIVADLSAQLVALDHQREQLARLLRTIDTVPLGQ